MAVVLRLGRADVGTWTGLDNYRKVLSDPAIRASFVHSFELIFFYAILPVVLGLMLASLIAHGRVRGVTFFRAVLFLPQTDRHGRRGASRGCGSTRRTGR